jgi:hypothetical protein
MQTWIIITAVAACLVVMSISVGMSASTDVNVRMNAALPSGVSRESMEEPTGPPTEPPTVMPTPIPTEAPTTQPHPYAEPSNQTQVLQFNGVTILHNKVPLLDLGYNPRRYYLVPGASFPGMNGQTVEQATVLIANSFPQLQVRAVRIGDPVAYEVRRDRITLQFDPFTRRVVSARIG